MADKTMITLSEAMETLREAVVGTSLPAEVVPVREAMGRIIVEDQVSRLDLPPFDKSAMDGFAVPPGPSRQDYRILETVAAGETPSMPLKPGTATKVMTGAPVPDNTARVVMVEQTRQAEGMVQLLDADGRTNICKKGEDVRRGDVVLCCPAVLGAAEIANLVSCGISRLAVARRARVGIVSTGQEIVDSIEQIVPGKIMNVNGPLLTCLCRQHALEVVLNETVPDDPAAILSVLKKAMACADIVVFSGGVSMGDFDCVGKAFIDAGLRVHFTRVAVKPGKPLTLASARGRIVFGLPGNPVSVFLTFHLFVLAAARLLAGDASEARHIQLPLEEDFTRRRGERAEYVPCRLTEAGALRRVEFHGSAHLMALSGSDGFFVVPQGTSELARGEKVDFLPTRWPCP